MRVPEMERRGTRATAAVAACLAAAALAAGFMALPERGAAEYNLNVQRACAEIRSIRPGTDCVVPPKRAALDTQWLLIAAVLGVGAAVVGVMGRR